MVFAAAIAPDATTCPLGLPCRDSRRWLEFASIRDGQHGTDDGLTKMARAHGLYFEDLSVGMSADFAKTITDADVRTFADISGDTNPVHLDEAFAADTVFEGRIAHGMLTSSLISTVLGTKLPGPGSIYVSQTLRFKGPVRIGDTVRAQCTVTALNEERSRVTFECLCTVNDEIVLEGEAVLKVTRREEPPAEIAK